MTTYIHVLTKNNEVVGAFVSEAAAKAEVARRLANWDSDLYDDPQLRVDSATYKITRQHLGGEE